MIQKTPKMSLMRSLSLYYQLFGILMAVLVATTCWADDSSSAENTNTTAVTFRAWGEETLDLIERDFRMPDSNSYYEDHKRDQIAFTWGVFVLMKALSAAAQVDPQKYEERLTAFIADTDTYWDANTNDIGGYDCLPMPKPTDRFYDDNAWMALALVDAYRVTENEAYLKRSRETLQFALSGEDDTHGGGIWWKETWKRQELPRNKAVCSTAGTALAAIELYAETKEDALLEDGLRLLRWLENTLQDKDGLFFNDIREDGSIGEYKWSYNTAVPLRCNLRLYQITGEEKYRDEALRIAQAAEKHWIDTDTGTIKCDSMFAFKLTDAWLQVYEMTKDAHWLGLVKRSLIHLRENTRDSNGRYPKRWDQTAPEPLTEWNLLWPSANAHAFLRASMY